MKTLSLLRHAKSGWDDQVERDFDRPLNAKGYRAAECIGRWLHAEGTEFDRIIASPALRVQQTITGVERGYGAALAATPEPQIYLASAATLLELVRDTPESVAHLLLIGHNPGLEDLLLLTTEGDDSQLRAEAEIKYPTASYARIALPIARWTEAAERMPGRLRAFIRPRDLDASLGPEF